MEAKKENILGTERIGKLLLSYSIPGIISMLVNSIYNMVDQIFIGQGVGYLGNAATNVVFPFNQIMMALGIMVAAGTAANVGLNLGKKREEEANHFVGTGFCLAVINGIAVLIIAQLLMPVLLRVFGATDLVMPYALDYGRIILIGFPFISCGMFMNEIVRMDGSPRWAMISMVSGAIVNLIFDPLFIFVFGWGVRGAALATIMGQMLTFFILITRMLRLKTLEFNRSDFRLQAKRVATICKIGISAFLTNIAFLFVTILLNNQAIKYGSMSVYGAEIPLTCFGIVMKINSLMTAIIIGVTHATQPIFSYNYGAQKYRRIRQLFLTAALTTIVIGAIGTVIFHLFPQPIINLFGQESELYNEFAVMALKTMTTLVFVIGIPMLCGAYFQSVGKPLKAVILSLSRTVLFSMPLMAILPIFFGVKGLLYAFPGGDILSILLSCTMIAFEMRALKREEEAAARS
ncbi:MAG: MATE family efflux transporter [Lachnospiraceae bacterium]|nr:MATE family efflux transporter [Lachnospiraceae bacterium]